MRALVTGGGGFLGRYIVERLLQRDWQVRSYSRRRYAELERLGVECLTGDLADMEATVAACAGVDVVFHVAAVAGIWGAWRTYYRTNTLGTEHVLAGCRRHGVGKLIYSSSPSVTFDGSAQLGIDETAGYSRRWLCHYPHSKALAEQMVLAANGPQLLTCALRPHLIWGPRDLHLIPRLLDRARSDQLRRIGDGSNLIDMVYVENAAEAHLQAADQLATHSPVAGSAYFISQGEPVNCWGWINEILKMAGAPPVERSISLPLAYYIGAAMEAAHRTLRIAAEPRMTRFLALQLGTSHYFDISRARRDLGYQPTVSIDEAMRRLAASLGG